MLRPGKVAEGCGGTVVRTAEGGWVVGMFVGVGDGGRVVGTADGWPGEGVVAGTVRGGLLGRNVAAAAPPPTRARHAATTRATWRRCARCPRAVMSETGAVTACLPPEAAACLNRDRSGSWDSGTGDLLNTRVLQTMGKRDPTAGQVRLDRAGGQPRLAGDLLDGEVTHVVQGHRAALLGRQLA